jgi:HAMP domain-containing protein
MSISLTTVLRGVVVGLVLLALTGWVLANVSFVQ